MHKFLLTALLLPLMLCLNAQEVRDKSDWPHWRGPHNNGISLDKQWNAYALKKSEPVWSKKVGKGYSSVVIQGKYLYTMGNIRSKDTIFCLDVETGKTIWKYAYSCRAGSYAGTRATPTVADTALYTFSREGHLFCFAAKTGKVRWQRQLQKMNAKSPKWGFASSPHVVDNLVIVNAGKYGMAFDKENGKNAWISTPDYAPGYATPVTFVHDGQKCTAIFGSDHLYVVETKSGKVWSSYAWETRYDVNAADPVISGNEIFISSGYGTGCALLELKNRQLKLHWKNTRLQSHFSTPVLLNGAIYGIHDNSTSWTGNALKCLDWDTGNLNWEKDFEFGTLMAADGKLIILDEKGKLTIAHAFANSYSEIVSRVVLPKRGAKCWTVPVLCKSRLFCRNSKGMLVSIDIFK